MESAVNVLECLHRRSHDNVADGNNEDHCFTELIYQMLLEIPYCEVKAMLKMGYPTKNHSA